MLRLHVIVKLTTAVLVLSLVASWPFMYAYSTEVRDGQTASQGSDSAKPSDTEIRLLIQRLGSKEPADVGVEHKIAIAKSRAVPGLIDVLSSKDWRVRARAAKTLGMIGDGSAVPALVSMARKKGERYESALDALGQIGGPEAATFLLELLPKESLKVQERLVGYLGLIGDNRVVPILCDLLTKSSSVSVRRRTAWALGQFRDPRTRNVLRKAIRDDMSWDVYRAAKKALLRQVVGKEPTGLHDDLIRIVIEKNPEPPEGAEKWLRRYRKTHPPSPLAPRCMSEPTVHSFVMPARYEDARKKLLRIAKHSVEAAELVEVLLGYMRHKQIKDGVGEKAMRMIVEIGKPGVSALENAVKRGDETLKANAGACLRKIANN